MRSSAFIPTFVYTNDKKNQFMHSYNNLIIHYNVIVFAIATMLYSSLISEFVAKCVMLFKTRLWNEKGREIYDNNSTIVCSLFCIIGYVLSLLFMPSLETALAIWSIVCLTDDIAWIILYQKHKSLFLNAE